MDKIIFFSISMLLFCLKNEHVNELGQKQGKSANRETFSAGLSTETVDFFPLAPRAISLQR
ncbi:MAG: hypothetical protein U0934_07780 [Pseudotabrizicola sp.]|uniref:hypothetical protein n=1 Tax=Pseudotabrizicola sp. TaxID=2939647 RepID=UPI00272F399A|nr:hypothetical protein [Pseudotabrizicola sp.]MDZ7573839.1 hypothetical protein [Pseudotabrizicola sp.]